VIGEKPVTVPLYLPQIPRRLRLDRARGSAETATISPLCPGPAESEV